MRATGSETRRDFRLAAIVAGIIALGAVLAAAPLPLIEVGSLFDATEAIVIATAGAIGGGLETAPALMAVILVALSLPCIAVVSRVFERSLRSRDATRVYRRKSRLAPAPKVDARTSGEARGPAFLEIVGAPDHRYPIHGDMLRIGREEDNDIRIANAAVHRYHAAISREDFDVWRITDLSGLDGNGLALNGSRRSEAILADGDVIDLGPVRLRFRFEAV